MPNKTTMISSVAAASAAVAVVCLLPTVSETSAAGGYGACAPPDEVSLAGVVRDFIERTKEGGHPDFERCPDSGFGHYMGNVSEYLDAEGKPVFTGEGHRVDGQWRNASGQPIHPSLFDAELGDSAGAYSVADTGSIQSVESFGEWFRDVPGTNLSQPLEITLARSGGTDDQPIYTYENNSFFPVDGQLFGNSGGSPDHNFHFTYEIRTSFTYKEGTGQVFSFYGDDDVWVYINSKLVIDIGGVHSKVQQVVELDRLGLEDGRSYPLNFFFAERHRTQSNFRIDTTLMLKNQNMPSVSAAYD